MMVDASTQTNETLSLENRMHALEIVIRRGWNVRDLNDDYEETYENEVNFGIPRSHIEKEYFRACYYRPEEKHFSEEEWVAFKNEWELKKDNDTFMEFGRGDHDDVMTNAMDVAFYILGFPFQVFFNNGNEYQMFTMRLNQHSGGRFHELEEIELNLIRQCVYDSLPYLRVKRWEVEELNFKFLCDYAFSQLVEDEPDESVIGYVFRYNEDAPFIEEDDQNLWERLRKHPLEMRLIPRCYMDDDSNDDITESQEGSE